MAVSFSFRNESRFPIAEIALAVLTVLLAWMAILSVMRRRIIWFFSAVISWICYSLVFYIIGIALSTDPSRLRDDKSASLACSALLFVGLAKSIVCRSIPGEYQIQSASCQQLLQMVFVLVMVLAPWSIGDRAFFGILIGALFLLWLGQLRARLLSASACNCIKDDLLISEYMSKKRKGNENFDPIEFKGLNYIVSHGVMSTVCREDSLWTFMKDVINSATGLRGSSVPGAIVNPVIRYDTLVTVEDIWRNIHLDSSESRDICLSFALFMLLRRRFRGCYLHESDLHKTRQFAMSGLLSASPNPLRAFHIIEAELSFLFDFFYISQFPHYTYTALYIGLTTYAAYMEFYPLSNSGKKDQDSSKIIVYRLLSAIALLFPVLGSWQLVSSFLSTWQIVNLVVNIFQRYKRASSRRHTDSELLLLKRISSIESYTYSIVLRMMRISRIGSYWSNRAGQYCLFQGDHSRFNTCQIPNEAKKALLNALRCNDGKLSDGRSSLSRNEAQAQAQSQDSQALSWACEEEFVAEKILVWHIATTLCHVERVKERSSSTVTRDNYEVANMLSDYCAYLVAFAPELITDDIYATRLVLDYGRAAAMERLAGEGSLKNMRQSAEMMDLEGTGLTINAQYDVVFKGKMLAAQLIKMRDETRWKVLAEFWAELMLFISPSDNSAAHLERLKKGGELITHLWALLTHAGILERPSGRDDNRAKQTSVKTSMDGEATTSSVPAESEIEVVTQCHRY